MSRPTSVLMGKDYDAIERLMAVHAPSNPVIVDVSASDGGMWKTCAWQPSLRFDINPQSTFATTLASWERLPLADKSVNVVVFDPPHLPDAAASVNSSRIWERRYGITNSRALVNNVSSVFSGFLLEAWRVLSEDGIVLAKIADLTHNHRYQWQHIDFVLAAQQAGFCACDLLIKADPLAGRLQSSKWKTVHHLRKAHVYWIVLRRSGKCEV